MAKDRGGDLEIASLRPWRQRAWRSSASANASPPSRRCRREGRRPRAPCRVPDGRGRDFEELVRRDPTNDRGVAASAGRINRVEGGKRDAFELKLTGDVRHDGAGLDGVRRATAVPDASSASGRYGTGMEPATRLRKSPIPAILAVVGGGIRRMSANFVTLLQLESDVPRGAAPQLQFTAEAANDSTASKTRWLPNRLRPVRQWRSITNV